MSCIDFFNKTYHNIFFLSIHAYEIGKSHDDGWQDQKCQDSTKIGLFHVFEQRIVYQYSNKHNQQAWHNEENEILAYGKHLIEMS